MYGPRRSTNQPSGRRGLISTSEVSRTCVIVSRGRTHIQHAGANRDAPLPRTVTDKEPPDPTGDHHKTP
jgi:hypothetical protein